MNLFISSRHPITSTGLFRLIISRISYEHYNNRKHISFKLDHKISNKNTNNAEWKSIIFDDAYICWRPQHHINIKLPVDLFDYEMHFRVAMLFTNDCNEYLDEFEKNIWLPWSNIIKITVPSCMTGQHHKTFKVGCFVKFKKPSNSHKSYGTILKIDEKPDKSNPNLKQIVYTISGEHGNKYDIIDDWDIKQEANASQSSISNISSYIWIDTGDRMEADRLFLIGVRENCDDNYLMNIYETLIDVIYEDYTIKDMKFAHQTSKDCMNMAKMISIDVINCLYIMAHNKQYKIECPFVEENEVYKHISTRLKLRKMQQYNVRQFSGANCDSCVCYFSDYNWMYKCKRENTFGHDLCLTCVYDMVKQYEQLSRLLQQLLSNDLSIDCIQSIAVFVVGNIVK